MFSKYIFQLLIFISLYVPVQLCAQERYCDTIINSEDFYSDTDSLQNPLSLAWEPCVSPFVEVLGKGFFSLNVDFRIKENYAISIGAAGIEEGVSPNVMGYYFGGRRHRLETGGGVSVIITDGVFKGMMVNGVIGYRYQKKKGLFFRIGFTPIFGIPFTDEGKYAIIPWAGLSLGYSF